MLQDEFAHLIDRMNAIQIALALRHAPREQSVASEDQALGARIILHRPFNHERRVQSRAAAKGPKRSCDQILY